jgi:hypothetical protein
MGERPIVESWDHGVNVGLGGGAGRWIRCGRVQRLASAFAGEERNKERYHLVRTIAASLLGIRDVEVVFLSPQNPIAANVDSWTVPRLGEITTPRISGDDSAGDEGSVIMDAAIWVIKGMQRQEGIVGEVIPGMAKVDTQCWIAIVGSCSRGDSWWDGLWFAQHQRHGTWV